MRFRITLYGESVVGDTLMLEGQRKDANYHAIVVHGNPSLDQSSRPIALKSLDANSLRSLSCSLVSRRCIRNFVGIQISSCYLTVYN